jgi:hypothetical protein
VWQGEQLCEVDYSEELAGGGDVGGSGRVDRRVGYGMMGA